MKVFLRHLCRRGISAAQRQLDAKIGQALETWVRNKRYVEPLMSVHAIAEDIGVPPDQLNVYIRRHAKTNLLGWRKSLRILEAKRLLVEEPDLPVSVVGDMVGISDKSNFKRQFADVEGMSPKKWRDKHLRRSSGGL